MRELHRIDAVVQASRVELDDVDMVWRGEGGSLELKRQAAYRIALCWNVLEGIPATALAEWLMPSTSPTADHTTHALPREREGQVKRLHRSDTASCNHWSRCWRRSYQSETVSCNHW